MKKTNLDIKFAQLSQTLSILWRTMAEDNGDVKDFKFLPPCGNLYVLLGIFSQFYHEKTETRFQCV